MSNLLKLPNPELEGEAITYLSQDIASGETGLPVDSTEGFNGAGYVIVGFPGTEGTELLLSSTISSATAIPVASTSYLHKEDDPVRESLWNQVILERATTSTGTFSAISTIDLNYENVSDQTFYNDLNGNSSSWYRYYYQDTSTSNTSSTSDVFQSDTTLYVSAEDVAREFNLQLDSDTDFGVRTDYLNSLIEDASRQIEKYTGRIFYTTQTYTDEYIDGKGFQNRLYFVKYPPISSITTLSMTHSPAGNTASWTELTEGRDDDYILEDIDMGMIRVVSSGKIPPHTEGALKVTYISGYTDIPEDIKRLCLFIVGKKIMQANVLRSAMFGKEIAQADIREINNEISNIYGRYMARGSRII